MSGTVFNTGGGNVIINMRVTGQAQATGAFAAMQAQLNQLRNTVSTFELELRNVDRTLRYMAAGAVVSLTAGLVTMAGELERQTVLMQTLEGTVAKANERMDQLVNLAQKVPYSLSTISDAFVKMRTAGINPIIDDTGRGPLKNLLDAVSAFGGTDQQIARASIALQQMAGKGTVSMEELRQQLGEAIPTAIQAMAAGMGISIAELIKKVTEGQVTFREGVNAMLAEFERNYAGAGELLNNTFFGSLRQLKTELDRLALSFNRGGGLDVFTAAVQMLTGAFRTLNEQLTSGTIQSALQSFSDWATTNAGSIAGMVTTFNAFFSILGEVATVIAGLIGSLPGEAIGGGLIGWILAGRAGLVAGVFLGPVADDLVGIVSAFASFLGGLMASTSSIGAAAGEVATFGVIGFLLFGRTGGLLGVLFALMNQIVGYVRASFANFIADIVQRVAWLKTYVTSNITSPFTPFDNLEAAKRDALEARERFIRENASAPGQMFGDISTTPFGEFFAASRRQSEEGAAGVKTFIDRINELRASVARSRAEFDRRFGQPNAIGGPSQEDISALEKFNEALNRVQDRLAGSRGTAIDAWARQQRRAADEFERTIKRMEMSRLQALDEGRPNDADNLQRNITVARGQLLEFRQTIDQVVASEGGKVVAKGNVQLDRFQVTIKTIREQIEAFEAQYESGRKSEDAEVQRVEARFAQIQGRLEAMRLQAERSKGSDAEQSQTLREIAAAQEQLNRVRERGIEVARRKASWEREDAQRTAQRQVEDARSALRREQLGQLPGGEFESGINQRRDALRASIRGLDDEIRTLERRVIESGGRDSWAQQWLENLRRIREGFQDLYSKVGTFAEREARRSKDLFDDIGRSLEDSFSRGLEVLISGTGKLKDVMTGFFNDVTRAVSRYLTNMLFAEMGAMGGNRGTGGLLMQGFQLIGGAIAGSAGGGGFGTTGGTFSGGYEGLAGGNMTSGGITFSANGNVFDRGAYLPKFARGGMFSNRIVSGPTLFNVGMMGEGGPEAIVPLARIGGKLGVASAGGGSNSYSFNITALDAASVRDLFYREGGAIVGSLQQRTRLNRGMR